MEEKKEEQDKIQQVGRMGHWVWPSGTFLPTLWGLGWAGALTRHETPPASLSLCRKQ